MIRAIGALVASRGGSWTGTLDALVAALGRAPGGLPPDVPKTPAAFERRLRRTADLTRTTSRMEQGCLADLKVITETAGAITWWTFAVLPGSPPPSPARAKTPPRVREREDTGEQGAFRFGSARRDPEDA